MHFNYKVVILPVNIIHLVEVFMYVKKLEDVPINNVEAGSKTTFQELISSDEGPHFAMRRFVIEAGGSMPMHTNTVEHEQFVLRGRARVTIGEQQLELSENIVILIPAGVPHSYENIGNEPYEFLCMVPNKKDTIKILK